MITYIIVSTLFLIATCFGLRLMYLQYKETKDLNKNMRILINRVKYGFKE